MKSAIYTFLLTLLSTLTLQSQTSLLGKVTDASSGEAVAFANVLLYKNDVQHLTISTDLDGNYYFSNLEAGIYAVEVQSTGYKTIRRKGINVEEGKVNRLNIELREGVMMDAVEIIEYSPPLIDKTKASREMISSSPPSMSVAPMKGVDGLSMRGSRTKTTESYMYDVSSMSTASYSTGSGAIKDEELMEAGQITAGEWNDLHNWKDWLSLLEEENYSIMMNRFDIHPMNRYSVLVVNQDNNVMANVPVQLKGQDSKIIWTTFTDNSGRAELWENAFEQGEIATSISVYGEEKSDIVSIDEGSNTFIVDEECYSPQKMDIVFTVDATSSMKDEINYLKSELIDVIDRIKEVNTSVDFNLGSVFYRDVNDEYLTRISPISSDIEETISFVRNQYALGGGDYPEAVDAALQETLNLSWREDALKLVFLVLDAPPHEDDKTMRKIRAQIKEAASRGIKLIPVTASGINRETEFLMKFMSILTNGTYVFITDDSGIGNPHLEPVVEDYEVEKLNDCLVRLITQYSKPYSCEAQTRNNNISVDVYPNPATQYINIKSDVIPDKIKVFSSNGMMVQSVVPTEKETRIEMVDFINGIYTVSVIIGDKVESKQFILLK